MKIKVPPKVRNTAIFLIAFLICFSITFHLFGGFDKIKRTLIAKKVEEANKIYMEKKGYNKPTETNPPISKETSTPEITSEEQNTNTEQEQNNNEQNTDQGTDSQTLSDTTENNILEKTGQSNTNDTTEENNTAPPFNEELSELDKKFLGQEEKNIPENENNENTNKETSDDLLKNNSNTDEKKEISENPENTENNSSNTNNNNETKSTDPNISKTVESNINTDKSTKDTSEPNPFLNQETNSDTEENTKQIEDTTYTIASGDTWGKMAKRFSYSIEELQSINPEIQSLHPGNLIKLSGWTQHQVQENETWEDLAQKYQTNTDILKKANQNKNLVPKEKIYVKYNK